MNKIGFITTKTNKTQLSIVKFKILKNAKFKHDLTKIHIRHRTCLNVYFLAVYL
jgi:hypothetical protein